MKIEETADKTVRGPWCFELHMVQSRNFRGEIAPPYYTGSVSISLRDGIGVCVSPEEAEILASILRDFAGRARQRRDDGSSPCVAPTR